jgi:predicted aspartyl protease
MTGPRVESTRVPYVPITVSAGTPARGLDAQALVDTGFSGFVAIPRGTLTNGAPPRQYLRWRLASDQTISAPAYRGSLRIGSTELTDVVVIELGSQFIIGMQVLNRFTLTIDHGRVLILEP